MSILNMRGSFSISKDEIDRVVEKRKIGNYALGKIDTNTGFFVVTYVGRCDEDVNNRLKKWIGKKYNRFMFSYSGSVKAAFEKECENFHDFGGMNSLDNKKHPIAPEGTNWTCPECDMFK